MALYLVVEGVNVGTAAMYYNARLKGNYLCDAKTKTERQGTYIVWHWEAKMAIGPY